MSAEPLALTVLKALQTPDGVIERPQAGACQRSKPGFFQMAKSLHQVFSEAFVLAVSKGSAFQEK